MTLYKNASDVAKGFRRRRQRTLESFKRGLIKAAIALFRDTQEIVPVETGALKRSGKVEVTNQSDNKSEVEISYSMPYALIVHEDLSKAHGKAYNEKYAADIAAGRKFARGPNQQAKFVEKPLRENRRHYQNIIKREMS